jgi:antitoxin component YwqK of YwqJK toxin-antitoxin module
MKRHVNIVKPGLWLTFLLFCIFIVLSKYAKAFDPFIDESAISYLEINKLEDNEVKELIKNFESGRDIEGSKKFYYLKDFDVHGLNGKLKIYRKPDNTLATEIHYKNGNRTGRVTHFYPNGKLKQDGHCTEGQEVCSIQHFDANGYLKAEVTNEGELLIIKEFQEHSKLSRKHKLKVGEKTSETFLYEYDREGNLYTESRYENDKLNGITKQYTPTGTLMAEWYYTDDLLNGESRIYFEDGPLLMKQKYKNDLLEGPSEVYYFNGDFNRVEQYMDGKLLDKNGNFFTGTQVTEYFPGRPYVIEQYLDGFVNGECKHYFLNGKLKAVLNYQNGKVHGPSIEYNEHGEVKREMLFEEDELIEDSRYPEDSGGK